MTKKKKNTTIKNRVQALNPRTGKWVKIDTKTGKIVAHKKSEGKYKGVRQARTKKKA